MNDLFGAGQGERIELADADVRLFSAALTAEEADFAFRKLLEQTPWESREIVIFGSRRMQPRQMAWYGDTGASYRYSGTRFDPLPWTGLLDTLRRRVETLGKASFNSVLLNLYRDGNDSMGWHSDDEPELGPEPLIASLSLGATRDFLLRSRRDTSAAKVRLPLGHGSLLLMAGQTQRNWQHAINKVARVSGPRINLTFRTVSGRAAGTRNSG
ncbi:alpha-ketoglutarate-dependent dioxygenase AlkB [Bacillus sp. NP157]|nr:alpha-ketoglutarate-dependent dioxygenase AlkB [Bacillus sp. NP157]